MKGTSGILPEAILQSKWRGMLLSYTYIYLAFTYITRSQWPRAEAYLQQLRTTSDGLGDSIPGQLKDLVAYLQGIYFQGTGDLDGALTVFRSLSVKIGPLKRSTVGVGEQVQHDLALLSALNCIWIEQHSSRVNFESTTAMLAKLQPLCADHTNKDIQTAYNLVKATAATSPPEPMLNIKNYLRFALAGAQATSNTHFLSITLCVMSSKFFVGVVGEQAEKSARAASVQAKKSGNMLWMSVADSMLAQCLEVQGRIPEARNAMMEATQLAQQAMPQT